MMSRPLRKAVENRGPVPIEQKAAADLDFIRRIMERASAFTAVPGWGGVLMGLVAFAATAVSVRTSTFDQWLQTWIGTAVVATLVGSAAIVNKARAARVPVHRGAGRRFVLSLLPALLAAGALTVALYPTPARALLPGLWMLLYGAGVVSGGSYSVRIVPVMGASFMILGAVTLFMPFETSRWLMGVGFGGIHVVFGWLIARRYGG